jgi:hypothetical protein
MPSTSQGAEVTAKGWAAAASGLPRYRTMSQPALASVISVVTRALCRTACRPREPITQATTAPTSGVAIVRIRCVLGEKPFMGSLAFWFRGGFWWVSFGQPRSCHARASTIMSTPMTPASA